MPTNDFAGLPNEFARSVFHHKTAHRLGNGTLETWADCARRVSHSVMSPIGGQWKDYFNIRDIEEAILKFKMVPGGRYLYAAGRPYHQTQNCLLLRAYDSREGWSKLLHNASMALMSGAGIGVAYGRIRPRNTPIKKTGGLATGPCALTQMLNEAGRHIQQGGSRRSAIWAGLPWWHPDIMEFIALKDWPPEIRDLKAKDFNFPARLDGTNISVQLDDRFFEAYHDSNNNHHALARMVYTETVKRMLKHGDPGFSIDVGENAGEDLRNACTEVTSRTNSDICNLASINLARVESKTEFDHLCNLMDMFMLAGTLYSDVPYQEVEEVRSDLRRLGGGLMGIAEWLYMRGKPYGPDSELDSWLNGSFNSLTYVHNLADSLNISRPIKNRAIAPTGTISIYAGTTGGIEPVFAVAQKRRFLKGDTWHYQYIVDPTARRLIEEHGIKPEAIEDAYDLAAIPERRVLFQEWIQRYVDQGISSTINLPAYGSEHNHAGMRTEFGNMLIKYLPSLRGITAYPDGARGGQPLTPIKYSTAIKHLGQEFAEQGSNICEITGRGECG